MTAYVPTVHRFVAEALEDTPGQLTPLADIYETFECWCHANDLTAVGRLDFARGLRKAGCEMRTRPGGDGHHPEWLLLDLAPTAEGTR